MQEEQSSHHLQLGELQETYRQDIVSVWIGPILGALLFIPIIWLGWWIYLFLVIAMILIGLVVSYVKSRVTILLYEQGVVEQRGKKKQVIRWEEVRIFRYDITHTTTPTNYGYVSSVSHDYIIEGPEKLKIRFARELPDSEHLFRRITQLATPPLLEQARQRLAALQEVPFDELTVSAAGIMHHQKKKPERFLPWSEVEVTLIGSEGQTSIKQQGNWHTWFEGRIPNTEVFHLLARERQEHTSYHAPTSGHEIAAELPPDLLPASFLLEERYEVIKRLGEGGFGQVYQSYDLARNRQLVAIKQITIGSLSPREAIEATESYHREIAHLSHLQHANLPRIYDHFTDQSHWYIVMEYIDGETLEEIQVADQPLPVSEVIQIGITLCEVLGYLHAQNPPIIFRDLKPSNIMRSQAGQLYLIDFGIARLYDSKREHDTRPLGTPGYAAPEQYGKAQPTFQADIYGLGATLLQLLTGREPLDAQDEWEEMSLPEELRVLLRRMLARDPNQRPRTADEVKQQLLRLGSP
jgi:predicted Ser/Thr protein kinase